MTLTNRLGGARQPAGHAGLSQAHIKKLERDLLCKDRARAEAAALLVLSKKVAAICQKGEDECPAPTPQRPRSGISRCAPCAVPASLAQEPGALVGPDAQLDTGRCGHAHRRGTGAASPAGHPCSQRLRWLAQCHGPYLAGDGAARAAKPSIPSMWAGMWYTEKTAM